MLLFEGDNAYFTANNERVIVTDEAAGRWLVAIDFGAVIEVKRGTTGPEPVVLVRHRGGSLHRPLVFPSVELDGEPFR